MTRARQSHWIILLLIVAFAGALRWWQVSLIGYWTDELCSLSSADGWGLRLDKVPTDRIVSAWPVSTRLSEAAPIWAIPAATARDDTHPPLYFLMLRMWEDWFGDSEVAARSLNIGFSLIAIVLLYFAVRETVDSSAALWAALLMAVASPQIMFSLEVRNYMPAMTFQLAAGLALIRLKRLPSIGGAFVFGPMLLAAMMTHYYSVGVAVALVIFSVLSMRGRSRWLVVITAILSGAIFLLLWGPRVIEQLPVFHHGMDWLSDTGPGRLDRWLMRLWRVPTELIAAGLPSSAAIFGITFLFLPFLFWYRPQLRLWLLWFICSLGLVAGLDLFRSTIQLGVPRYLLFTSPAAYVILSAAGRGRWRWIPPAVGVLVALLSLRSAYVPSWKIDLRSPVQTIGNRLGPDDGLVISGPDPIFAGITYAAFQHYLPKMPDNSAVLTRSPDTATLNRLKQCPHVWIVWTWADKSVITFLPGIIIEEHGHIPSFGDLILGHFVKTPSTQSVISLPSTLDSRRSFPRVISK